MNQDGHQPAVYWAIPALFLITEFGISIILERILHQFFKLGPFNFNHILKTIQVTTVENNRNLAEEDITKADFELLEYDRLSIQGTNDASSIKERLRIISKFLDIVNMEFK
jgi:hypothetical protein